MAKKKELDLVAEQVQPEAEVTPKPVKRVKAKKVQQDKPVKGIFKKQVIKQGVFRLSAGEIDGLDSTDKDWVMEVIVHGRKVYILSEEAYENSF